MEIAEPKRRQTKTIAVAGGVRFAQSFSKQRLIDEYNPTIYPVVLCAGLPRFTDPINLKLLDTRAYDPSAVLHNYRPA